MKLIVKGVICLVAAAFGCEAFGAQYYVSATATGLGDGSSWANTKAQAETPVLPKGYARLASLTSTGEQRINLKEVPNATVSVKMNFNTGTYGNGKAFFGQAWNSSQYLFNEQSNNYMFHGSSTTIGAVIANQDACLEVTTAATDNLTLTIGETVYKKSVSLASAANATMYLFGCSDKNRSATFTLYDFTMWRNGTLAHQWVPAKELSTGNLGIVDLANPKSSAAFLPNVDSGADFTPGAYVDSISVDPIPAQLYTGSAICPMPCHVAFVHEGMSTEQPPSAYSLSYANNVNPGRATVTIKGTGGDYFSASVPFSIVKPIMVTLEGAGAKDGSSWENAKDWASAFSDCAASADDNEIWIWGDIPVTAVVTAVNVNGNLTIRGGFNGTESALEHRSTDTVSTFSGNDTYNLLDAVVTSGKTLCLDRCGFTKAKDRALQVSGSGNVELLGCSFTTNGCTIASTTSVTGAGFYSSVSGMSTVRNCSFVANGPRKSGENNGSGWAVYATGARALLVENCNFQSNGTWTEPNNNNWSGYHYGVALRASNTPVTIRGSRFAGNICRCGRNNSGNGIVYIDGACGGSLIENTSFIGNQELMANPEGDSGGIVDLRMSAATDTVEIKGCTFAHNVSVNRSSACALTITKGAVHVTDSIFYNNILGYPTPKGFGTDIHVAANGSLHIENSTLASLGPSSITSANPANLTMDVETMSTEDPCLATSVLDAEACMSYDATVYSLVGPSQFYTRSEAIYTKLGLFDATPISPKPVKPDVGEGNVIYVKGDATGSADGSSWANAFTTLDAALAVASAKKNEIWIAGDLTVVDPAWVRIDRNLVVRGGFAGGEAEAAARTADARSTLDGAEASDLVRVSVKPDVTVRFERIDFKGAKAHAVDKRSAGHVAFENCDFVNNGRNSKERGRAVFAPCGGGAAELSVSNCQFKGQMYVIPKNGNCADMGHGGVLYVSNHRRLTVDDSVFVTNGIPKQNQNATAGSQLGSVLYDRNTPVTMRRTRIAGNCGAVRVADADGGTVYLQGLVGGSAFTNCAFVGNYELRRDSNSNTRGGALVVNASADHTVDIQSCTFAYNVSQAAHSASALTVRNGIVTVNNSIFWKNPHGMTSVNAYGCEIEAAGGTTVVRNSIVTSKDTVYCHGGTTTALTLEGTVYTDDPRFVTSNEVFEAMYSGTSYLNPTAEWTYEKAASLDVHLLSPEKYFLNDGTEGPKTDVLSPAVDKGDASSDCSHETTPNGGRINIGAYGNTPEGSATPYGVPKGEDFTVDYPNGITRPRVSLKLGLKEGSGYTAKVVINCYQGGELIETKTFDGVPSGNTVEWLVPRCFAADAPELTFTYEIQVAGVDPATDSKVSSVEGEPPPYAGKGGDAVKIIHVRAGADYKMNGTSWTDAFPDLKSAFDAVTADTEEIWVSEGVAPAELVLTLTQPLKVRGGFAGTENSPGQRPAGTHTVFDYNNISPGWMVNNSASLTIERIDFVRAKTQALNKSGAGDLTLDSCRLLNNGRNGSEPNGYYGRALYARGDSAATITVTNCAVEGNLSVTRMESGYHGCAFNIGSCKRLVMDDTLFASNGLHIVNNNWAYFGKFVGFAVYATSTPVTARRCQFRANAGGNREGGATVYVESCDKCAFTNCVFVGNYERMDNSGSASDNAGALTLALGAAARTADIEGCTFAYNVTGSNTGAGGLNVRSGTVTVKDSIFWRNFRGRSRAEIYADEIEVKGGSCTVTHSLITGRGAEHARAAAGATLSLDPETVYELDPSFVSSYENDFLALYTESASAVSLKTGVTYSHLAAFDVHLLSPQGYCVNDGSAGPETTVYSQAIDKGDPDADWSNEPSPNGKHVNLGAYGNTKEASLTSVGQPEVTSFEVPNPNDYARPEAHLKMGIASGTDYSAKVTIVCTQDGEEIGSYEQLNVHNGDEVVWLLPRFVDAGAALVYSYTVEADDAETVADSSDVTAGDKYPDYYGKGGGENVIHVRYGADCTPTGDDWTYAYPDLASGLAAAAERGKGEVWVTTSNFTFTATCEFTNSVAIRGGFAGTETAARDRVQGALTTLDNGNTATGLVISNGVGTAVTFERLAFSLSQVRAIEQKGGGELEVFDCRFVNNGRSGVASGRGVYVSGGKTAVVRIEDCLFAGNMNAAPNDSAYEAGGAVYLASCATAIVSRCLFETNGLAFKEPGPGWTNLQNKRGSALFATATKLFCRDCRFAANATAVCGDGTGGTLYLEGASGGSVIENCAFVGNYETHHQGSIGGSGGAIAVNLNAVAMEVEVRNCTFAHNVTIGKDSSGGLTITKGTVRLYDSLFWKNLNGYIETEEELVTDKGGANDIEVKSDGRLMVENVLVASDAFPSVRVRGSGTIGWAGNLVTDDPLFVTTNEAITALYTKGSTRIYYQPKDMSALAAINVHLRGGRGYTDERTGELVKDYVSETVLSPALDAGSHRAPREPRPNGGRKNLGAYGNTPWATRSAVAGSIIWFR